LSGLLSFGEPTRTESLKFLTSLLGHKYPRVRQQVAEQLYASFITFEHLVPQGNHQAVLDLLANTRWDQSTETAKEAEKALRDLLAA